MATRIPSVTVKGPGTSKAVIGGKLPVLISGPCVIESRKHAMGLAKKLKKIADSLDIPYIFKASFDKANRTSITSYRGPGLDEGLDILMEIREKCQVPVTTDVHETAQVPQVSAAVDLMQVPAFLSRQTDLVVACGESGTATSIKKGQFAAPADMANVIRKFKEAGGKDLVLIERGSSFGYNNLVSDMRSLPLMRSLGVPVIYDATHSVQMPGGGGDKSSGSGYLAPSMLRAAIAVGVEGVFIETHEDPGKALSDGPNMIPLKNMKKTLGDLLAIHNAIGRPGVPV